MLDQREAPRSCSQVWAISESTGTMTSTRMGMWRTERSAAGTVASTSRRLRSRGTSGRRGQSSDESQQHEQKRQVGEIVEVRRKPLVDEAVHGLGSQSLKRVPVKSDAIGIHGHQRHTEGECGRQPFEAGQTFLPWFRTKSPPPALRRSKRVR